MKRVELVCVGTELLMGKVSTHSVGLSERLRTLGLAFARETVVGDDPSEMESVFLEAWRRGDLVLCSGGLGPTFDDITRDVWSKVLKRPLRFRSDLFQSIRDKFRSMGLPMPPMNRRQAFLLDGAEEMENPNGTAPGQRLTIGRKTVVLLPGPGRELFPMVDDFVLPWLRGIIPAGARETRVWRLFGEAESDVDRRLRPLVRSERSHGKIEVAWGILAQEGVVDVELTVAGTSRADVSRRMKAVEKRVRKVFGKGIYGTGRETLEEAVGGLLKKQGGTLALAESCTGGGVAERITRVPGSSAWFVEGLVTYANEAKKRLLGVPESVLKKHGAVSRACALAMADGVRRRARTTWGVSVTGIAGPDGGSAALSAEFRGQTASHRADIPVGKPVGLVFIAAAGPGVRRAWEHRFSGDRARIRERSALWALERLRRSLTGKNKSGG